MAKTTDDSTPFDVRAPVRAQGRRHSRSAELDRLYGSVCELAAAVFDLPMAFLSLGQGETLTPVATYGIADIDALDTLSVMQRQLIAGQGVRIEDATRDSRYFLESAVLRAPHIRFYVDMPLAHEGEILGVIAIADVTPGEAFSAAKQAVLAKFADQAATLLALAQGWEDRSQVSQKRLDMAAELAGLGYWTIDLVSREVVWSKGLYALLGLSETLHRPQVATQLDIYQAGDRPAVIEHFQRAVNTGEDFDFELRIVRKKDKAARLIRTRGGVEYDGDGAPVRLCAVVRDVTEAASETEGFLAHVADELRAPLNEIVGYARLMETQPVSGVQIASYARHLQTSAEALKSLIDKTPEGLAAMPDADDESIDIADMIRETADSFMLQAEAAQTRLSVHFVDFIHASGRLDAMRVRQVLQNLLSNACKFTNGGVISVTASQVTAENPHTLKPETRLHVSVRDTGTGMEETRAHGLFKGGKSGLGRGLGLSVAQTIIEMLDGHIGASSRPGEGTHVWFEIPVDWTQAPVVKPDPKATPVPRTLTRQSFDMPQSRPAYAPLRPRFEAPPPPEPARHPPVDEDRINREYLRALLQDMKLDLQWSD
jgi:signal transduction histidine kinase